MNDPNERRGRWHGLLIGGLILAVLVGTAAFTLFFLTREVAHLPFGESANFRPTASPPALPQVLSQVETQPAAHANGVGAR
ncbi:MAG: hypothetical protein RMN52_14350 [Anaerolineae bacterium]|nr:hypothetical protein [Candidatus Roseilinea sp.]MDW8451177.1 hypothetical protein [Anaerolineae bacterium]